MNTYRVPRTGPGTYELLSEYQLIVIFLIQQVFIEHHDGQFHVNNPVSPLNTDLHVAVKESGKWGNRLQSTDFM